MTHYAAQLSKRALSADESSLAQQYVQGATEAGYSVTRETVASIFPPGVRDLVMRYLRGV